jgi:hypothetical protein
MRTRWRVLVGAAVLVGIAAVEVAPVGAKGEEPRADTKVLRRETDDGVSIRVATGPLPDDWGAGACTGPGCMPKPCLPRGIAIIGLSTASAVGEGYVEVYRTPSSPLTFGGAGVFGTNVDDPVGWVAIRTGPKTERVEVDFAGGGSDSMRPVDGWALLAAPIADAELEADDYAYAPSATVRAVGADGATVRTLRVDASTAYPGPPEPCPSAALESGLPKGTGRAPTDEEQARSEILAVYAAAYSGAGTSTLVDVVEDGAAIVEVARVAAERYPEYAGRLVMVAEEIRFLDVDEAAVQFALDLKDPGTRTTIVRGVGRAVLRDGAWLVSRATFCSVLAQGGSYCPLPEGTKLS